jgi:Glycosyl transferase family 2
MTPAVSVIVPTFQRREQVLGAARSVLAQTFEDFELIVVDDGSTDGTGDALAGLDPRLRYEWQENRGVAAARNAGIRLARGGIVAFLDSDNRWFPSHLSVVTRALGQFPQAVLVSTCPGRRVAGSTPVERAAVVDHLPIALLRPQLGYVSCTAVRREALLAVDGFDERLSVGEDSDLWLRLSMCGPVCLLSHRTIEHRTTRGGLKERGIRSGAYLRAVELTAQRAKADVRRLERPDRADLIRRAQAKLRLVEGVRALTVDDREAARRSFRDACRLLPALSRQPSIVIALLTGVASGPARRLALARAGASCWPDPRSDTACYLRGYAFVVALRSGRPRAAVRCLAGARAVPEVGFVARTLPLTVRLLREWHHERVPHGQESLALPSNDDLPAQGQVGSLQRR